MTIGAYPRAGFTMAFLTRLSSSGTGKSRLYTVEGPYLAGQAEFSAEASRPSRCLWSNRLPDSRKLLTKPAWYLVDQAANASICGRRSRARSRMAGAMRARIDGAGGTQSSEFRSHLKGRRIGGGHGRVVEWSLDPTFNGYGCGFRRCAARSFGRSLGECCILQAGKPKRKSRVRSLHHV
jgi:hypothetical protein